VELDHSFRVPADLDTVWRAVLDPERVAPCMPGATLTEVSGSSFSGTVKVKLGPISLLYKGSGEFLESDAAARRMVIKAAGKDSRGNGTASATVTVSLRADGDDATAGSVHTDLSITGKPAQFGRGMISEVGGKILDSFATCLASKLGSDAESVEPPSANGATEAKPVEAKPEPAKPEPAKSGSASAATKTEARPVSVVERERTNGAQPKPAEPEAEPIDLLSVAGPSVFKRAAPLLAAALAVLAVVVLRRRGR
jgi:carbon monoxide dehydrogenase subunit G